MKVAWIRCGGAAGAVVLTLLMGFPARAADHGSGMRPVAVEELDKRSKQPEDASGKSKGLSDTAVRVLMTYAFSIIPKETAGPDGKPLKVDKSDPTKFLIPTDDARRVVRAATRSAYAEVCGLIDLGRANYETMLKTEKARQTWSREQLLMIDALHIFSVSYFAGHVKITTTDTPQGDTAAPAEDAADTTAVGKSGMVTKGAEQSAQGEEVLAPPAPKCPPEQKQRVKEAITAYVQAAQAGAPKHAQ
jgi:hypothetical protein